MTTLTFSLSGEPRGQGRPRATVRGGHASVYKDPKSRRYEDSIAIVAKEKMAGRDPFEGPLSVSLRFRMPIPKSATKRTKTSMAAGEIAHTGKPDADNLVKAVLDGLNSHSKDPKTKITFMDDAQIVRLFVQKLYAEQPGVDVRVEAYQPQGAAA